MRSSVAAVKYERTYGRHNNKKSDQDKTEWPLTTMCARVGVTKSAQRGGREGGGGREVSQMNLATHTICAAPLHIQRFQQKFFAAHEFIIRIAA